jgi:hypothetical protein
MRTGGNTIRALASRHLSQSEGDARSGSIGLRPECDGILGWQRLVGKKPGIHAGVGFQWIVADGSESPTPGTGT